MTRQKKTPRQRAEEALAVAERRVRRLTTARDTHRNALAVIQADLEEETKRRDYLARNPDLPPISTTTTEKSTKP